MKQVKQYKKPKLTVDELSAALYQANQELQKKNEELISMQKIQSEIFTNISHDLRSPITAIRSGIEYLTSIPEIDTKEQQRIFQMLTARIISLETLINDIFLMTRLDHWSIPFKYESCNIGVLLEEYFYNCDSDPMYQNYQLILDVPKQFNYYAKIDTEQLIRVLDNLFTNARKYSEEGSQIILGAKKEKESLLIWVQDTGIGIPKELRTRIFERTFTVSSARTPKSDYSAGLGLAIAKLIMHQMGGDIWCDAELEKGSRFFLSLSIQDAK